MQNTILFKMKISFCASVCNRNEWASQLVHWKIAKTHQPMEMLSIDLEHNKVLICLLKINANSKWKKREKWIKSLLKPGVNETLNGIEVANEQQFQVTFEMFHSKVVKACMKRRKQIENSFEYSKNSIKLKGQLGRQLKLKVFHLITIPLNINDRLMSKNFLNYSCIRSPFIVIIYLQKKLQISKIGSILDDTIKWDALALLVQNTQILYANGFAE